MIFEILLSFLKNLVQTVTDCLFQGTTLVVFGPTLLDLADHVGVGISELAAVLFCRSVGSVIGAGGSGYLCDRFHKASLWMLCIDMIGAAICEYTSGHCLDRLA